MKTFITIFGLLVFSISSSAQDNQVFEYLTMFKLAGHLHISIGSTEYEKVNIKSDVENVLHDMTAVNERISFFEEKGWEFVSADHTYLTAAGSGLSYNVVMRRPKK